MTRIIRRNGDAQDHSRKILNVEAAAILAARIKEQGQRVVLCHGVFDLLHLGHVRHLDLAAQEGEFLIVSITADAHVHKGPGRPVFPAPMRAEMLASLEAVDCVVINNQPTAESILRAIRPNIYVKGSEYANVEDDVTGKIADEQRAVEEGGGHIVFTDDVVFSSSSLINRYLDIYDPALREYLESGRSKNMLDAALKAIDSIANMKVLIVGDAIIDEYLYVAPMGKSPKENMIATRFIDRELFSGGVFAAANHIAGFCKEVRVITCLGANDPHESFIMQSLKPNVGLTPIRRPLAPTTRKTRFVDEGYLRKMFEVYTFDDKPLDTELQEKVDGAIAEHAAEFDLVIVADFGHGLIAPSTIDVLNRTSRFLAVNTQTNSANHGFNLITKYPRADFVCIDTPEARLAAADKNGDIETVVRGCLSRLIDCPNIIVTLGRLGCLTYARDSAIPFHQIPAFTKTILDTVGAGDAFLAVSAPLVAAGTPLDVAGFIGNAVGALKVGIVGHRQSIEKPVLVKSIRSLLK